eukprot:322214-Rhodomonas_salina.1
MPAFSTDAAVGPTVAHTPAQYGCCSALCFQYGCSSAMNLLSVPTCTIRMLKSKSLGSCCKYFASFLK